jgi:ATP-dependent Clp protease protease subunit
MAKQMWELKQSAQPDTLDLFIYGDIEDIAIDWVNMVYVQSENSAKFFKEELAKHPDVKQINVFVNSLGGYLMEAMAIRNQLKRHPANVTGYVDGLAASAAAFILTGCDQVKMYSNTMQMIHNAWSIAIGNPKQLHKAADDLAAIMVGNRKAFLEKAGAKLTEGKLIELLDAETQLTAEQCLEYGLADEIIAEEKDLTTVKQMLQKMNTSMEQQLSYNKSLAAQLRELAEPPKEPDPPEKPPEPPKEPEPEPTPDPEPQENKTLKLMAALFR